jgi:hypothetical protein
MDRPAGQRKEILNFLWAVFVGDRFYGTLLAYNKAQVNLFTLS